MRLDETFANFITDEIEKHVRMGMAAVFEKIQPQLKALDQRLSKIDGVKHD